MSARVTLTQDRLLIFHALEVLNLITDRLERDDAVDPGDMQTVLQFLHGVAHRCLDYREELLKHPALSKADGQARLRVDDSLRLHRQVHGIFKELMTELRKGKAQEFVLLSRAYTNLFADLIFKEDVVLPDLIASFFDGESDQLALIEFEKCERHLCSEARQLCSALHQMEMKYTSPHCI